VRPLIELVSMQAYGVARYREINPTTFTLITFPFLFAVMFGDVGHALMMVAFAALLLWCEKSMLKQKLDDITEMIFGGRYIILLMGIFSIFTGFMYNEFFSMPMSLIGGTHYKCNDTSIEESGKLVVRGFLLPFRELLNCTRTLSASAPCEAPCVPKVHSIVASPCIFRDPLLC
jgi:vacuolar-type H+-ATPase subunit I/STV1